MTRRFGEPARAGSQGGVAMGRVGGKVALISGETNKPWAGG
ncbi:hypothetical protein [Mycolicibacterium sp. 120270]|nr:hypothetical protein [Mycolicibacterium sp. 120270]MDX1884391.1 hypothetical protein [Mycolicibacterium sp. 120270]